MAAPALRLAINAPGRFYTDDTCIDCDLCRNTAPGNFTRSDETGFSYVFRQPATPGEEEACREALKECPTESIGEEAGAIDKASG